MGQTLEQRERQVGRPLCRDQPLAGSRAEAENSGLNSRAQRLNPISFSTLPSLDQAPSSAQAKPLTQMSRRTGTGTRLCTAHCGSWIGLSALEPGRFHIPWIRDCLGRQPSTQSLFGARAATCSSPEETGAGQEAELEGPRTLPSHSQTPRTP